MTDHDREQVIEELVQSEPTVDRTLGQKVLRVLAVLSAAVSLAAAGVLVIAYAQLRSCTNANFSDPAGLQKAAVAARVSFGKASHQFASALTDVFSTTPGSSDQRRAVTALKVDSQRLRDASRTWQAAEHKAYTYRISHPLDAC